MMLPGLVLEPKSTERCALSLAFLVNKLLVFAGVAVFPLPGRLFLLVNVFNLAAECLVSLSLCSSSSVLLEEAASTDLLLSVNIWELEFCS